LSRLRSYGWFVPVIYLYTFVLGTLSLWFSLFDRDGRVQHLFARTWSHLILKTVGIRVHVAGLEHIDSSQAAVYAPNHLSAVDIPVLYASLPVQFRIMAKKQLFRYPFLGWHLKRSGQIPIDPDDAHASLRSLNRASDSLRKGTPLVVFPEGGRSATGRLQEFLGGAFYVAIRAQAPIVPMALIGTYEVLPMNSFHLVPGHVDLLIGKPISTTGMRVRDRDKLGAQVRQALLELYDSRVKGLAPLSANDERQTKPMLTPES